MNQEHPWRLLPLTAAVRRIAGLWGESDVDPKAYLTPDWVADHARAAGYDVRIERARPWEERTDEECLGEMMSKAGVSSNDLIIVSEASYGPAGGAFEVSASDLQAFLREHRALFEPVVNGDLIVAGEDSRVVVCLHHSSHMFVISPGRPED